MKNNFRDSLADSVSNKSIILLVRFQTEPIDEYFLYYHMPNHFACWTLVRTILPSLSARNTATPLQTLLL
jgi:hypothetical protein